MSGLSVLGHLLRPVRAGDGHSLWNRPGFQGPELFTLTSPAFADGTAIPAEHAGKGAGPNIAPALSWNPAPAATAQLLLVIEDIDVPFPRPLIHTAAVFEPRLSGVAKGELGTAGAYVKASLGATGYAGPRPIPGHGPHRYGFYLFALDQERRIAPGQPLRDWRSGAGRVLARGRLVGTYELP